PASHHGLQPGQCLGVLRASCPRLLEWLPTLHRHHHEFQTSADHLDFVWVIRPDGMVLVLHLEAQAVGIVVRQDLALDAPLPICPGLVVVFVKGLEGTDSRSGFENQVVDGTGDVPQGGIRPES
ncbi:MAG: hypothetical protein WCO84_06985, partial [bacterium]